MNVWQTCNNLVVNTRYLYGLRSHHLCKTYTLGCYWLLCEIVSNKQPPSHTTIRQASPIYMAAVL
jgi:hypothetical protein